MGVNIYVRGVRVGGCHVGLPMLHRSCHVLDDGYGAAGGAAPLLLLLLMLLLLQGSWENPLVLIYPR